MLSRKLFHQFSKILRGKDKGYYYLRFRDKKIKAYCREGKVFSLVPVTENDEAETLSRL